MLHCSRRGGGITRRHPFKPRLERLFPAVARIACHGYAYPTFDLAASVLRENWPNSSFGSLHFDDKIRHPAWAEVCFHQPDC
ncbi:hypothetical protein BN77_0661 [Rhizobium mesoamericanum STM3625]|uniref:Uncharacterized protein n=1 Tax=Rhizobium mesoamericanum STM3625 TaxID=1211777 RepID=K0PMM2_9HYPH|nr:hypothetical protein BN77_0661 [Rhizobium mesoamericanum STM3625]